MMAKGNSHEDWVYTGIAYWAINGFCARVLNSIALTDMDVILSVRSDMQS